MSELSNVNSIATNKQGEFKPSIQPSGKPQEHGGVSPQSHGIQIEKPNIKQHQLGRKVAPQDFTPEFHTQAFPPGTAPADKAFPANTYNEPGSQANNPNVERGHGKESVKTSAADTMMGPTSQQVHQGYGQPLSGQTSTEIRHGGQHGRKHESSGLEGVGSYRQDQFERTMPEQRGLEREHARGGQHGDKGTSAAEDIPPQPAERLAQEWQYEPTTKRD